MLKAARRSILKEINPEYLLEELMLKLKCQYFGHLMQRSNTMEKTLMLGKIEGKRRREQRMRRWDSISNSMDMNLSKLQEIVKDREAWYAAVHGVTKSRTWLSDWTELNKFLKQVFCSKWCLNNYWRTQGRSIHSLCKLQESFMTQLIHDRLFHTWTTHGHLKGHAVNM